MKIASLSPQAVQEASVRAVVTRCGCGDPASHPEAVCPKGVTEDLGVVSYYHRNPFKRLAFEVQRQLKGKK
jgi:hypothetical protein